jgi:hypothetical protein
MSIDARKNFARGTVSTGYDASATSIVLTTGHAARFPVAPFNVTWWNATDYPNPSDDPNVEVVRVTAIVGETLTVTRAQESTSASTKNTASKTYKLSQTVTAGMITAIETDIAAAQTAAIAAAASDATTKANAAQSAAISTAATDATTKADAAKARSAHTGTQPMSTISDAGTAATKNIDTDGTLAANSDLVIPTQKAVKTYADQLIAAADAMVFNGVVDCSANPNYPAADRGHTYRVSVAGKIGGASGINVEAGDILLCLTDGTAGGDQAAVGASWSIAQVNLDGTVIGPVSATDSHFAQFDGTTGKLLKGGIALDTDTTLAADSDTRLPSQKAVKAYADTKAAASHNHAASDINSGNLGAARNSLLTYRAVTGTSDTLVIGDAFLGVDYQNAAATVGTVPPNASVAFTIGTVIHGLQSGAGQVTITPGSGVTINSRGGALKSAGQYARWTVEKMGTNTWLASGDLTT